MPIEIIVPSPGESITQVQIAKWLVADGESVEKDQEIVEIDSDKASFPIASPTDGIIKVMANEGDNVAVGAVIATIEPGSAPVAKPKEQEKVIKPEEKPVPVIHEAPVSPLAEKLMVENKIKKEEIKQVTGDKRISRKDIVSFIKSKGKQQVPAEKSRDFERKKLSMLRMKVAERLVSVKNETAMLTTFNEVNMRAVLEIKKKFNDPFKEKYGVGVGLLSFFTKAVTLALKDFPQVNSMIDGDEQILPGFVDVGIAVSAPKGLIVPVIRNAECLSFAEIEKAIKELATKAREGKITIDEMKGGTFTISNGGVFGSLLSTPILNPPQSAILGLHKIMDRPIAVDGKVEIHPMMYLALSYDHRIIDGRESVGFLVKVKEYIEDPIKILTEGEDPVKLMLDL
ncbi:MAG: 2-oxoglutarate dehydrogenase complex dihydrolipoyllysine-residue succinyltransferase [Bacteroidota bacterium]